MIEADARRHGRDERRFAFRLKAEATPYDSGSHQSLGALTRRYWYHFTSLAAIAVFMAIGMSAFKAVFWSGCWRSRSVTSGRDRADAARLYRVLRTGGEDVLGVAQRRPRRASSSAS